MAEKEPRLRIPEQPANFDTSRLEQKEASVEIATDASDTPSVTVQPVVSPQQPVKQVLPQPEVQKSQTLERIEDIMEHDLDDVYAQLPPEIQKEFRQQGEETAAEIEAMMYKVRIKSKKVFSSVFRWLRVIPHVNKYFLKQEAKLKTDAILDLKEDLDKQRQNQL